MAYIGNAPADRFTSIPTVQQFNGDGSTTAFTLSRPVGTDQDLLVSVDGVIQDTAAYAVSNGTTLTFSAAPSTGTANIFVNYLGVTIGSVVHPASSALAATTGAFSGKITADAGIDIDNFNIDGTTIALSSGDITLDAAGRIDLSADDAGEVRLFDGSLHYGQFKEDSSNFIIQNVIQDKGIHIKTNSGGSEVNGILVNSTGAVTMPTQPAFSVHKNNTDQNNLGTGDITVAWSAERFDVGANFASNAFTAPVTGKYQLQVSLRFNDLDADHTYMMVVISTSKENYRFIIDPDFGQDAAFFTISGRILADMDANDTASVIVNRDGGASTSDIEGDAEYTHFSGFLAC